MLWCLIKFMWYEFGHSISGRPVHCHVERNSHNRLRQQENRSSSQISQGERCSVRSVISLGDPPASKKSCVCGSAQQYCEMCLLREGWLLVQAFLPCVEFSFLEALPFPPVFLPPFNFVLRRLYSSLVLLRCGTVFCHWLGCLQRQGTLKEEVMLVKWGSRGRVSGE